MRFICLVNIGKWKFMSGLICLLYNTWHLKKKVFEICGNEKNILMVSLIKRYSNFLYKNCPSVFCWSLSKKEFLKFSKTIFCFYFMAYKETGLKKH